MESIREHLLRLADPENAAFSAKLMPNLNPDTILGIKLPVLKSYAKELYGTPKAEAFLKELPHRYLDENNLHAFLLMREKEFSVCLESVERFLPYIDNWATCDSLRPPCFRKHLSEIRKRAFVWVHAAHPYTVRYGIECYMCYFLDGAFQEDDLALIAAVQSEEYYVRMMIAWYFATALAKQYEATLPYLEKRLPDDWVHRKTIQKAFESYRIPEDRKQYLKSLR